MTASFTFTCDGVAIPARPGQTVAAALLVAGLDSGLFCAIGVCQGCLVDVAGRGRVVACQSPAEPGMLVSRVPPRRPPSAPR
ncbi:MAG: (2Fe-2S)-binding protein [Solirubrobacterales bacterium]|nr:(2Fe-2S)-binding protein [Solirubrobacterales bacterium]